jgi:O-antigen/teichoic acid export membrane protein
MKSFKDFALRLNTMLRAKLTKGSFSHNVLLMFIGTAIGQMGSVILSPALTRIYSPDNFGVLGIYMMVIGVLSLIASLRYEIAIPLIKTEEEAANILAVCTIALFSTSIIIGIILYCTSSVPEFMQSSVGLLWQYRMMIPLGIFTIGAYQILVSYATHKMSFKIISQTKVYQGYGGPITQIILGLAGANIWGLITGFVIGQSLGASMMFKKLIPHPQQIFKHISRQGIKSMAWRFRDFPLISSFSAIISALGSDSILLIAIPIIYHSTTVTGFIFLINRIVERPLLMVSTSILQVYMGDVSKTQSYSREAMRDRFLKVLGFQFVIAFTWLAIINATAKYIIPFAFGSQWADSVPYIYILTISYLPRMTLHAVTHTLQILEKQKLSAIWDVCRLLAIILVFVFGYIYNLEVMSLLLIYCVTQAIANAILFILMYKSIQAVQIIK